MGKCEDVKPRKKSGITASKIPRQIKKVRDSSVIFIFGLYRKIRNVSICTGQTETINRLFCHRFDGNVIHSERFGNGFVSNISLNDIRSQRYFVIFKDGLSPSFIRNF